MRHRKDGCDLCRIDHQDPVRQGKVCGQVGPDRCDGISRRLMCMPGCQEVLKQPVKRRNGKNGVCEDIMNVSETEMYNGGKTCPEIVRAAK